MPISVQYTDPAFRQDPLTPPVLPWYMQAANATNIKAANLFSFNTRRGARTITRGGWNDPLAEQTFEDAGFIRKGIHNILNPRSWRRAPSVDIFDPIKGGWKGKGLLYDDKGNTKWVGKWLEKRYASGTGRVAEQYGDLFNAEGQLRHVWDPHMFGRWSASGEFGRISSLNAEQAGHAADFLRVANPDMLASFGGGLEGVSGKVASQALLMSARGVFSARIGGYIAGASGRELAPEVMGGATEDAIEGFMRAGVNRATREEIFKEGLLNTAKRRAGLQAAQSAGEETAGRVFVSGTEGLVETGVGEAAEGIGRAAIFRAGAGALGEAAMVTGAEIGGAAVMGGLNPIMDALAIYGIAKLGFNVAKIGTNVVVNEVKAGLHSFMGQIGKDPMGMGYRDTEAAATSRQRGVMAIANSRLNARSLLGNEAQLMAQHFG